MLGISFQSDIEKVFNQIKKEYQSQVPFAASRALNEIAFDTRDYIKDEMKHTYDGGVVRYTQNAVLSTRTNKRELHTRVYISDKDPHRLEYIINTIDGGIAKPRDKTLFEPVKGRIRLTKTGNNIPRGAIGRLLKKAKHFQVSEGGKMAPGVYKRVGRRGREEIRMLVAYTDNKKHRKVFKARQLAYLYAERHFSQKLIKHLRGAIRTMR